MQHLCLIFGTLGREAESAVAESAVTESSPAWVSFPPLFTFLRDLEKCGFENEHFCIAILLCKLENESHKPAST